MRSSRRSEMDMSFIQVVTVHTVERPVVIIASWSSSPLRRVISTSNILGQLGLEWALQLYAIDTTAALAPTRLLPGPGLRLSYRTLFQAIARAYTYHAFKGPRLAVRGVRMSPTSCKVLHKTALRCVLTRGGLSRPSTSEEAAVPPEADERACPWRTL